MYYVVSLVCFTGSRFIIVTSLVTGLYAILEIQAALFIVVDLMPIVYMVYCHVRMFKR